MSKEIDTAKYLEHQQFILYEQTYLQQENFKKARLKPTALKKLNQFLSRVFQQNERN